MIVNISELENFHKKFNKILIGHKEKSPKTGNSGNLPAPMIVNISIILENQQIYWKLSKRQTFGPQTYFDGFSLANYNAHLPAPMIVNISAVLENQQLYWKLSKRQIFGNPLMINDIFLEQNNHLPAPMIVNISGI